MKFKVSLLFLLVALLVAACGGDSGQEVAPTAPPAAEEPAESAEEPAAEEPAEEAPSDEMMDAASMIGSPDPLAVSGNIVSAGSSTVFPLAERIAERYQNEGFGGDITIDSIGSGAGFERFCVAGETDVSNASRPIKDSEVESCNGNGRAPIEFRVGTDALAVVVSQDNDFLEDASIEELQQIFGSASTWADVRAEWPAEPIQRFIPGTDSGTFDYFTEEVFDEDPEPQLTASNVQQSEDDNVLVQGVAGSPYAIGYFGYAYAAENTDLLHPISIEGVEASAETVDANEYPLARPLFIYSDGNIMMEKAQVADYVNFFLTYVNDEVVDVGYFPASDDALNAARDKWVAAMSGEGESVAEQVGPAEEEAAEEAPAEEAAEAEAGMMPVPDPLAVSGNIVSAGSSTVFPLAERIAERYQNEGFGGDITIDSIGSGAGFERFCVAGETDVSNASRPIKDSEVESCNGNGRAPIEFRVGTDALAVVVSTDNDFIEEATIEELQAIFGSASTWADVNPDWPAEPIQRFIPGTDSGTFDYFTEEVFDEDPEPQLTASNVQQSEDDNVLVQGVAGSPYAIGYFGYAYAAENTDLLHPIAIEGVEASAETVDANEYPLARPLFIYSDGNIMQEKAQVADYVNFFLTYVNDEVVDVGYFPASDDALNAARDKWMAAMAGEGDSVAETAEPAAEEEAAEVVEMPVPDPLAVSGNIVSAGSSTVFPLAERIAERYQNEGFGGDITIDSIGSGAGFERFCVAGETDVSNASRPIKDSEVESCQGNDREPIEFRVGTDALAVVVSTDNDFIEDATIEELQRIFGSASTWADVRADWPAEPIQRFIPGTDSGTFDYFTEEVFDEDPEPQLTASNVQQSEDDNVLVQGVAGSPYAIGYFGYAYAAENTDLLHPIAIEGVEASAETVDANEYPLARPLFIYSDSGIMTEKAQVADYVNFFLTYVNDEVIDVGYFPASDEALNEARTKWLEAMGQ